MKPDDFPPGGFVGDYAGFWIAWLVVGGGTVFFFRRTRGRTGKGRLVAGNLLVLASLLASLAIAGETYLRYVYDATDSWGPLLTQQSWVNRHVVHNAEGFRDREWTPPPPGVETVTCIGDSFTEGWGVPDVADCWPQRVGAALAARFPGRFDVRNLGRSGWDTDHEVGAFHVLANRGGASRAILGYCLNDADDLLPADRRFGREQTPRVPLLRPTTSFLADFLWFRLHLYADPRVRDYAASLDEPYRTPEIWSRERMQFAEIAETCRAAGVRLHVLVFPYYAAWGPDYPYDFCHEQVGAAWRDLGVETIDLRDACRGIPGADLRASRFDGHPNARAHEIAARAVLERVFGVK